MHKPLSSIFAYVHLLIGVWLTIHSFMMSKQLPGFLIALVFFFLSGFILRGGERFAALQLQHEKKWIPAFLIIDTLLIATLVLFSDFQHSEWVATLIVLAYAAEYGKKATFISVLGFLSVGIAHILLENQTKYSLEHVDLTFMMITIFVIAVMLAHKTDMQRKETYTDSLTELPNLAYFMRRLSRILTTAQNSQTMYGILLLDIQRFQQINEHLGHGFGDQLIHAIGQRLRAQASNHSSERTWVARHEGDQFIILINGLHDVESIEIAGKNLISEFEKPWKLYEHVIELRVHGGMSIYPLQSQHCNALLEQAKIALQRTKNRRTSVLVYAPENNSSYTERYVIEAGMRKALERTEFVVYYQPKVNIQSGAVMGIEALVRWNHPELGLIPPNKFIHIAEENGMIIELGDWVLRSACEQHAVWLSKGLPPIRICVNVSLKQLENPTYFEQLNRIIVESGLQPRHLELEITETLALKNVDSIQGVLAQLAGIGVKLTIDDFGTGYASYKHLSHLPIHALKIDKSFMRGINHNPDSEAIVASIIQLAKSLQLTVTAEGVETFEQLQFLKRNSCDEVQGFLYMQPEPANVFEPHLKRGFAHISQAFQ
jgi:diguanylate cyclase (GGDEF)-like protein